MFRSWFERLNAFILLCMISRPVRSIDGLCLDWLIDWHLIYVPAPWWRGRAEVANRFSAAWICFVWMFEVKSEQTNEVFFPRRLLAWFKLFQQQCDLMVPKRERFYSFTVFFFSCKCNTLQLWFCLCFQILCKNSLFTYYWRMKTRLLQDLQSKYVGRRRPTCCTHAHHTHCIHSSQFAVAWLPHPLILYNKSI